MSHPTHADIQRVREFLLDLQARICAALEQQEQAGGGSAQFEIDDWQRPEGGGGRSRVLQNGTVIEKGGVMFSHINISKLPASATDGCIIGNSPEKPACTHLARQCAFICR